MKIHTGQTLVPATQSWTWEQRSILGQRLLKDLAGCLIRLRNEDPHFGEYRKGDKDTVDAMQKALELDGYIYREKMLIASEESVIEEQEEEGIILDLARSLQLHDFQTLKHHLDLSTSHYQESRWDDSISNSRKVLEGILRQVAEKHSNTISKKPLTAQDLDRAFFVRDYLEKAGVLEKKEKETLKEVYGLLSETGGHPNIAHKDQARLMRHLALTFCQFVLLRFEGLIAHQ